MIFANFIFDNLSELGRFSILVALACCVIGMVTGLYGGYRKRKSAEDLSKFMAYGSFAAMTIAMALMWLGLWFDVFSVSYIAKVGSPHTPAWVTIVSLWSDLEGSILLWGFVLTGFMAAFAYFARNKYPEHTSWALGVTHFVGVFFCFLLTSEANPFLPTIEVMGTDPEKVVEKFSGFVNRVCGGGVCDPVVQQKLADLVTQFDLGVISQQEFIDGRSQLDPLVTEGPGPNALLQNHILMVIHPPMLYLGYVGMSLPFGMGCAALLAGKIGPAWSLALRRWILLPWCCLTVGIILGGWWSYEVLGWGGYWDWDPVENASFLPWLTATAFVHSALLMERKGQLKGWAICLLLTTFLLTILGTFMTRSGVFNSVHAFGQKDHIGQLFLIFLAVCTVISIFLLSARIDALAPDKKKTGGVVSRDTAFLLNNLLFTLFTFVVLLGTLFPIINEAITDKQISVKGPYFNRMSLPISVAIVFLMGVGPALPWGRASKGQLVRRLRMPILGAVVGLLFSLFYIDFDRVQMAMQANNPDLSAMGYVSSVLSEIGWSPITFIVCGFAMFVTIRELYEPALHRMKKTKESFLAAQWKVAKLARRRFGGYIVHIGVILSAIAIAGSGGYSEKAQQTLYTGSVLSPKKSVTKVAKIDDTERNTFNLHLEYVDFYEIKNLSSHTLRQQKDGPALPFPSGLSLSLPILETEVAVDGTVTSLVPSAVHALSRSEAAKYKPIRSKVQFVYVDAYRSNACEGSTVENCKIVDKEDALYVALGSPQTPFAVDLWIDLKTSPDDTSSSIWSGYKVSPIRVIQDKPPKIYEELESVNGLKVGQYLQPKSAVGTRKGIQFDDYQFTYSGFEKKDDAHRTSYIYEFQVLKQGTKIGSLFPRLNHYKGQQNAILTPAVYTTASEDVYLTVNPKTKKAPKGEVIDDSRVELNMHVKPLVVWLWLGGLVMVVGTLISLWPKSRKRKTS